jgi:hypothetical protein
VTLGLFLSCPTFITSGVVNSSSRPMAPFAFEKDGPGLACGARGIGRDHALMALRASQPYQSDEQTLA